jgi:outer membrane protein assembly factor BamA
MFNQFYLICVLALTLMTQVVNSNKFSENNLFQNDLQKQEYKQQDTFIIRRVEFSGNRRTRDSVLRRNTLLNEGDPFSEKILLKTIRRINKLGLFYKVKREHVILEFNKERKLVDIQIKLKER